MNAVTCLVAQNTTGLRAVHVPPVAFLEGQLRAVSEDVTIDAVKLGMLGTRDIITTVARWLDEQAPAILIIDPVMVSTSGDRLLAPDAEAALRRLCRRRAIVTPNIPELAALTGEPLARSEGEAVEQAMRWSTRTGTQVVVKTGHLDGQDVANILVGPGGVLARSAAPRVRTTATHGTGCSLASALATRLAAGQEPEAALAWVTAWLHEAVAHGEALKVGRGNGPIDHAHRLRRAIDAPSAVEVQA